MIKSSLKSIFNYGVLMLAIGVSGCGEQKTEKNITPKRVTDKTIMSTVFNIYINLKGD